MTLARQAPGYSLKSLKRNLPTAAITLPISSFISKNHKFEIKKIGEVLSWSDPIQGDESAVVDNLPTPTALPQANIDNMMGALEATTMAGGAELGTPKEKYSALAVFQAGVSDFLTEKEIEKSHRALYGTESAYGFYSKSLAITQAIAQQRRSNLIDKSKEKAVALLAFSTVLQSDALLLLAAVEDDPNCPFDSMRPEETKALVDTSETLGRTADSREQGEDDSG
eukprot:1635409-Amphidinium_carterae.1